MKKVFYILAGLWLLILVMGDSASEFDSHLRGYTILLLFFVMYAVFILDRRIDRAVKQIQEPDFDNRAAIRKEWLEAGQIVLVVVLILVLGTAAQGFFRCLSSDSPMSTTCIWRGILEQIGEDLGG